jgi:hypothetical protein
VSNQRGRLGELIRSRAAAAAAVVRHALLEERLGNGEHFGFRYELRCFSPVDPQAVVQLRAAIAEEISRALRPDWTPHWLIRLQRELAGQPFELAWDGAFLNLVPTGGADDILTKYFAGSTYTAAWYMGLVNGNGVATVSITTQPTGTLTNGTYTGVALADDSSAGVGAVATVTVSSGAVSAVTITAPGENYAIGDTLYIPSGSITGATANGVVTVATLQPPTFAAGDTMASHAGWTENASYSNAARPTLAFGTAASRSIALSSAAAFNINGTATIAGGFFTTVSTIGGTTGILYSAGAFTGGNKAVASGDTLSVSATQSV